MVVLSFTGRFLKVRSLLLSTFLIPAMVHNSLVQSISIVVLRSMYSLLSFVMQLAHDSLQEAEGLRKKNIEQSIHLLSLFGSHRIQYEASDLYDAYFAYLLIPSLALIGLYLLLYFGLFTAPISSFISQSFISLCMAVILVWMFLCSSDPGRTVDSHGYLTRVKGLNPHCRQAYQDSIHGKRIVSQSLCATCEIERPTRCKHCSKCDVCIMRLDHHCI